MEDLRDSNKKEFDEKLSSKNTKTRVYTEHLPSRLDFLKKNIKKNIKLILIISSIVCLLIYPHQIGSFCGDWLYNLKKGFIHEYKK